MVGESITFAAVQNAEGNSPFWKRHTAQVSREGGTKTKERVCEGRRSRKLLDKSKRFQQKTIGGGVGASKKKRATREVAKKKKCYVGGGKSLSFHWGGRIR